MHLILERFIQLSKSSTVHGWSHSFRTDRLVLKIMWIIFFLGSTGVSIYFITKTVLNFLEYDIVTEIDVIYERKSEFPTVTFCTDSPGFNDSSMINNILINCTNNLDKSCQVSPKKFFSIRMTEELGTCYQYNGGSDSEEFTNSTIYSYQSGIDFGLFIVLKLNQTIESPTIFVLINNSSKSIQSIKDIGFRLSPGKDYYFNVNREYTYKMEYPYNDCYRDLTLFSKNKTILEKFINSNIVYSREKCFEFCFGLDFLLNSKCSCNSTFDLVYESCYFETNNTNLKSCFRDFKKVFSKKNIYDMCSNYCPMECDYLDYNIISSIYNLPKNGKTNKYSSFNSYEEIQKSYFAFYVYYENLAYKVIKESPKMEIADFVSNIGGTCGLFIGMSFLSFLEILEFLIEVVYILLEKENK